LKPEEVLALDHRTAITFTPGIPPLRTVLVRYYERGFREGWRALARLKVVFLSILTFAAAVMIVMALLGVNIHRFISR
jgi:type IV secretion system protein VirD4